MSGHTTRAALDLLRHELRTCLAGCDGRRASWSWLRDGLHPGSQLSLYRATSATFSLLQCLCLVAGHASGNWNYSGSDDGGGNDAGLAVAAAVLLLLVAANVALSCYDSYLRGVEMFSRARLVLAKLDEASERARWEPASYPHLHTPPVDSIILEWTLRDGTLVNLPWALLHFG